MAEASAARQWVLAERPSGLPKKSDFRLIDLDMPTKQTGKVLVRVHYHTVAPGVRARLAAETYAARIEIGDPIPGYGVGIVEWSGSPEFEPGDIVAGELAWATHALANPLALQKLDRTLFDDDEIPLHAAVGALGASGLTAYFGLLNIGEAQGSDTVLISSAAGAVGSMAGQIGKIMGCRVIGLAGTDEKCVELKTVYGFDEALNYRAQPDLAAAIGNAAPDGIDLYFDNVGGEISEAAIAAMKLFGRVVICGQISNYNNDQPTGFRSMNSLITKRLTMRGFIVHDFAKEFAAARIQIAQWLREGKLVHNATVVDRLDDAAEAFVGQFSAGGFDRPVIKAS